MYNYEDEKEKNSERTERDGHKRSANLKHPSMARTVSTGWSAQWQCDQTLEKLYKKKEKKLAGSYEYIPTLTFFFFFFFGNNLPGGPEV